ncbi:hypothetical protein CQA58_01910 [Helicobacter brantae]|uniref:VWFA domain-containing protein n=2 Tax=Helicobacter brantae TaxID=375927 RepID=A0A3D8J327_9HELI|nr:hypothetical protein CQA58_01910 [Helicobacter brantae]
MDTIIRLFKEIKDSSSLQKICDLLGELEKKEQEERTKKIMEQRTYTFNEEILSKEYKEEIVGVSLGRDIENLLPQELGMLDDNELEILFYLKFIQNRLFCFEKEGYSSFLREEQIEEEVEQQDEDESQDKGAMIICVDTSGSMMGDPELIAKAATLFLAAKAKKQKRPCFLINFSTEIECMELSKKGGIVELEEFLSKSFNGGTTIAPALKRGIEKMKEPQFEKSDLLVISDGGFGLISDGLRKEVLEQQELDNRFYLLDVSTFASANDLFDKHWRYDPATQEIDTLYDRKNAKSTQYSSDNDTTCRTDPLNFP